MPATKAEQAAYTRKLREIERRFGTLERGTMKKSIDLLKQLRANVAGEITQLSDWEQFRILQTRTNLDALITQYQGQLRGLSNGAVRQAYGIGQASVMEPLEQIGLSNLYFQPSQTQVNALVDFSADLIQNLGEKFRGQINREIQLSALGGKSIHATMQDITRILYGSNRPPPFTPNMPGFKGKIGGVAYDAERILRTEMNRAHNLAAQSQQTQLAEQVPGLRKQWLSTGDARTRLTHLYAHGKVVPVDEKFQVGGASLMFPGDPAGTAEETINCRCRSVTVIPEVEDLSLPVDAKVQAEIDKRDAAKKAKAGAVDGGAGVALTELERERFRAFNGKTKKGSKEINDWSRDSSYSGWTASLTDEERGWLTEYKLDGYEWINSALRGDRSLIDVHGWTDADFEKAKGIIDRSLRQHRLPNDVSVWRGGAHPALTDALQSGRSMDDLVGMVISDDAYISSSLNKASADKFYKMAGKDAFKFEIQLPRGSYGAYIENINDIGEFEFLLPRNSKFEILDARKRGGARHIIARVIEQ